MPQDMHPSARENRNLPLKTRGTVAAENLGASRGNEQPNGSMSARRSTPPHTGTNDYLGHFGIRTPVLIADAKRTASRWPPRCS